MKCVCAETEKCPVPRFRILWKQLSWKCCRDNRGSQHLLGEKKRRERIKGRKNRVEKCEREDLVRSCGHVEFYPRIPMAVQCKVPTGNHPWHFETCHSCVTQHNQSRPFHHNSFHLEFPANTTTTTSTTTVEWTL